MERHIVLLGDSIFDNSPYVQNGLSVIEHLWRFLPLGIKSTQLAQDGDVIDDVLSQLTTIPPDATHFVLSVGGNDALGVIPLMAMQATSVSDALMKLTPVKHTFANSYRALIRRLYAMRKPTAVCTIYESVPGLAEELITALSIFNDVIVREALAAGAAVIDLREICCNDEDYSTVSPIEPSEEGGRKIALAIKKWIDTQ